MLSGDSSSKAGGGGGGSDTLTEALGTGTGTGRLDAEPLGSGFEPPQPRIARTTPAETRAETPSASTNVSAGCGEDEAGLDTTRASC